MRNTIMTLSLFISVTAFADIEYSVNEPMKATSQEISRNRACFKELEVQGCGDPAEEPQHFRSCLSNVHSSLTSDCQKMMSELYGTK